MSYRPSDIPSRSAGATTAGRGFRRGLSTSDSDRWGTKGNHIRIIESETALSNSASGLKIRAPILRGPKNGPPTCAYRGCHIALATKAAQKPNPRASLKVDGPLRCSNLSSLSRVAPVASFQKAGYNLALGMLNNACRLASSASRLNLRIRTPKAPECAQTEVCPPFSASKPPDLHTPGACVCAGGRFNQRGRVDNGVKFTFVC